MNRSMTCVARWLRVGLALGVALSAGPVLAADAARPIAVVVEPVIPYLNAEDDDHDASCDWNRATLKYLAEESEGRVTIGPASDDRPRLQLSTQTLHVLGGGIWTGPKWLVLEGRLTHRGQVIGSFEARRQSIRGSLRSCSTVSELGEAIADDVLKWLEAPTMNAKLGDAK